jgi:hypothetical protein
LSHPCSTISGRWLQKKGTELFFNPVTPTFHLLDLLFEPEATMNGKAKTSRSLFTYLNRLKLKRFFQKNLDAVTILEHPKTLDKRQSKRWDAETGDVHPPGAK